MLSREGGSELYRSMSMMFDRYFLLNTNINFLPLLMNADSNTWSFNEKVLCSSPSLQNNLLKIKFY